MTATASRTLFLVTLLTGSFLLFLIQPMIARMALPRLGGAPAVWNSAMLVYQALLLGGYAYAHALGRLRPRTQAIVHMSLFALAALWLPVGLSAAIPAAGASPLLWVPWLLASSVGPLFFVVAAQAPLMQRWYGLTSDANPYPLYAASNLGSFAGLICYPLLVEPGFALGQQSMLWSTLFIALVFLVAACGTLLPGGVTASGTREVTPAPSARNYAKWIALAAVPSGLMLSTTTHLTTDVVAVPLLWVVPLGLYLLSFTVAFAANRTGAEIATIIAPLLILSVGGLAFATVSGHPVVWAAAGLILLFVVAVALHAEMYRTRPAADHLTGFYLAMSVGGVLGGIFCALVAPALFDWTYEHPLLILAAAALVPQTPLLAVLDRLWSDGRTGVLTAAILLMSVLASGINPDVPAWLTQGALVSLGVLSILAIGRRQPYLFGLIGLMAGLGALKIVAASDTRTRSYFGVYAVETRSGGRTRALMHGTTLHGLQLIGEGRERTPTTYYAPASGIGVPLVNARGLFGPGAAVGVVGLGTGTLACYRQPGQRWTFFEIDPAMVRIARDPEKFSFLSRCAPDARVVVGDARLTLAQAPAASLDLIALDAFSSDAVPMHLLTTEAMAVYARALQPGGLLMVHVSNRYLDLQPLIDAVARTQGWTARVRDHQPDDEETVARSTRSIWIAMARNPAVIDRLVATGKPEDWEALHGGPQFAPWTDDYATILPLIDLPDLFD